VRDGRSADFQLRSPAAASKCCVQARPSRAERGGGRRVRLKQLDALTQ
jgi:hypothetical protein